MPGWGMSNSCLECGWVALGLDDQAPYGAGGGFYLGVTLRLFSRSVHEKIWSLIDFICKSLASATRTA